MNYVSEQIPEGLASTDPTNGSGEQGRQRNYMKVWNCSAARRYAVGYDNALNRRMSEFVKCARGEHAVGCSHADVGTRTRFEEG